MKRIFIAAALLGLFACNREDVVSENDLTPTAISFNNVATRAGLTDLQTNGFGVWAFLDNGTVQNYVLMDNQQVTYDSENGVWTYSPAKYWVEESVFTFVATYPYDATGTYFTSDTTNECVNLEVTETPSQADFLIATNVTDTNVEGYATTVPLQFQHVLTQVGLQIWRDGGKHQNDQIRVKKVTLSNIRKGGEFTSATSIWTPNAEKMTVEAENSTLADTDNIGVATVNDDGTLTTGGIPANLFGDMLLIPQTLDASNTVSLKIVYELKLNNGDKWTETELETVLPEITWEAGRRYTYNVVLSSVTDITMYYIQTKVDPWGTPQVGGTVIIK